MVSPPPTRPSAPAAEPVAPGVVVGDAAAARGSAHGPLRIGQPFGRRYRILGLLGVGGMGAVYKAFDEELDIPVALKVIRPEVAADPKTAAELDRRFKRELLLARQVTHKNVIRIHDLGDVDGIRYITMTFIEGETLAAHLQRKGKLTVEDALPIVRSTAAGLAAAHAAGVVHRDLKPSNIMIDNASGEAFIMDFGIARSASTADDAPTPPGGSPAMPAEHTAVGTLIGTLQYMAPEQFLGHKVDQRADVYALGLIFYDLLVGDRFSRGADSAMAEFRSRMEKTPPPPRSRDLTIPETVNTIITRCLDPEAERRFASAGELADVLFSLDEHGQPKPETRRLTGRMMAVVAAVVATLLVATWWLASRRSPVGAPEPVSVLIADFVNSTDDPSFAGALEQTLSIAMEGSGFISAFPRPNALRIASQLSGNAQLDETTARLISRREGIGVILAGSIAPAGKGYELAVRALDPGIEADDGEPMATAHARADGREEVLSAVTRLASELRRELGDTTPKSALLAEAETFTAASLEAMSAYARGQDLLTRGRFDDAAAAYREALQHDPEFGRAYAGLGVVYGNLHQEDKAEASYQEALKHLDRMSERERYRTLGGYYLLVSGNYEKAIESYTELVQLFPADGAGHSNLAYAYHKLHQFDRAVEAARRSVELEPGNLIKRINYAMYAMYAGDFTTAITESRTVLEQNPDFGYAHFTLGRSAQAVGDIAAAREAFAQLGRSQGYGSWLAPLGEADLAMYLGRPTEAVSILGPALTKLESADDSFTTASAMVALAEARLALGQGETAAGQAEAAVALSDSVAVLYPAARVLLAAGRRDGAFGIATQLDGKLQQETTAAAGLIRGEMALADGHIADAIREFRNSREQAELWFSHYLMGRAYFAAEHFPEAFDELDTCLRRAGEVTDVFLADGATLRYLPPAVYWLARSAEALGQSDGASARYRQYLELRGDAQPADPLAEDAEERLGGGG